MPTENNTLIELEFDINSAPPTQRVIDAYLDWAEPKLKNYQQKDCLWDIATAFFSSALMITGLAAFFPVDVNLYYIAIPIGLLAIVSLVINTIYSLYKKEIMKKIEEAIPAESGDLNEISDDILKLLYRPCYLTSVAREGRSLTKGEARQINKLLRTQVSKLDTYRFDRNLYGRESSDRECPLGFAPATDLMEQKKADARS